MNPAEPEFYPERTVEVYLEYKNLDDRPGLLGDILSLMGNIGWKLVKERSYLERMTYGNLTVLDGLWNIFMKSSWLRLENLPLLTV